MPSASSIHPPPWPWPESLDALAAAPGHHRLLFENDRVRVLATAIPPGGRTPVHTHRWPAALSIQSWSDFVRYDDCGKVLVDSRTVEALRNPPAVLWSPPLAPHALHNCGAAELRVLAVELKDAPA